MGNLFRELKRRQVLPVAGGYVVISWVLIQVADVVVPALALPEIVITAVIAITITCFPIAIVLAWIFDITADGIKRTLSDWHSEEVKAPTNSENLNQNLQTSAPRGSVAVLPFANIGGQKDQEYLSDGVTETLITSLSKIPDIFVIASESSFYYKGKSIRIKQISEELGVRYVLEGSVQRSEKRIRITAQLIDAIKGHHLWAENYDRELDDLFDLQDDIALNVLRGLQVQLTESDQLRGIDTDNLRAYLKLKQGNYNLLIFKEETNVIARQRFKEAIILDPQFSDAYNLI